MEIGSSIVVRGPTPNHRKNQSNVIYDLRVRRKNSAQRPTGNPSPRERIDMVLVLKSLSYRFTEKDREKIVVVMENKDEATKRRYRRV